MINKYLLTVFFTILVWLLMNFVLSGENYSVIFKEPIIKNQ